MHLISSKKLESDLANGRLDQWEKTKYLIFTSIFAIAANPVFWPLPVYEQIEASTLAQTLGMLAWVANGFLTFKGVRKCFAANKLIDSKAFIERFTVLFVPASVQMFIVGVVWALVISLGFGSLMEEQELYVILTQLFSVIFVYLFFLLLHRSFLRLSLEVDGMKVHPDGVVNASASRD
jgi:hypothetical protein